MTEKGTEVWWWHFPQTGNVIRNSHMFRRVNWLLVTNAIEWPGKLILSCHMLGQIEILTETGVQFLIWHCVVPWACDQIFPSQFFSENIIYSYLLILLLPAFVLVVVFFKEMLVFQNTIKMQVIFERFQSNHAQFGSGTAGDVFLSRSGVISKSSPMLEIQCLAILGSHFPQHSQPPHPGSHHSYPTDLVHVLYRLSPNQKTRSVNISVWSVFCPQSTRGFFDFFVVGCHLRKGGIDLWFAKAKVLVRVQKITGEEIEIHLNPEDFHTEVTVAFFFQEECTVRRIRQTLHEVIHGVCFCR